jgi:ribose 5-phosphate isomerase RpiB
MKIAIGSDHAGYSYKQQIIAHLKKKGHEVDFGTHSAQSTDYPPEVFVTCSHPIPAPVAGQILS